MSQNDDLISRQAAIDALAKQMPESYTLDGSHPADEEIFKAQEVYADCIKTIELLPAVQPDHVADSDKKVSISCGRENDVISRKAAIDALARMMPRSYTPDGSHPADEEIFRVQEVFVDCIEALEILPPAQPEQRWIPCSERLPEESGKYLVTVLDGIGKRTTSAPYHLRSKSWTLTGRMAYWKVIAWMPLPASYKGE